MQRTQQGVWCHTEESTATRTEVRDTTAASATWHNLATHWRRHREGGSVVAPTERSRRKSYDDQYLILHASS